MPVHPELPFLDGLRKGFTLLQVAILLAFEDSSLSSVSDYGMLPENQLATELDTLDDENFNKFLNLELISLPTYLLTLLLSQRPCQDCVKSHCNRKQRGSKQWGVHLPGASGQGAGNRPSVPSIF